MASTGAGGHQPAWNTFEYSQELRPPYPDPGAWAKVAHGGLARSWAVPSVAMLCHVAPCCGDHAAYFGHRGTESTRAYGSYAGGQPWSQRWDASYAVRVGEGGRCPCDACARSAGAAAPPSARGADAAAYWCDCATCRGWWPSRAVAEAGAAEAPDASAALQPRRGDHARAAAEADAAGARDAPVHEEQAPPSDSFVEISPLDLVWDVDVDEHGLPVGGEVGDGDVVEMTDVWRERFKKTRQRRMRRIAGRSADRTAGAPQRHALIACWVQGVDVAFRMCVLYTDKYGATLRDVAAPSTSRPTTVRVDVADIRAMYGDESAHGGGEAGVVQQIVQLETQLNARFESFSDRHAPAVWPEVPVQMTMPRRS